MVSAPVADIRCTWIELRGAWDEDPGEIALIHYIINGTTLSLTDALGRAVEDSGGRALSVEVRLGENPSTLARRLTRQAMQANRSRKGTPLFYAAPVIV